MIKGSKETYSVDINKNFEVFRSHKLLSSGTKSPIHLLCNNPDLAPFKFSFLNNRYVILACPPGPHIGFKNLVHSTIFTVKFLILCKFQPGGCIERTSPEFYVEWTWFYIINNGITVWWFCNEPGTARLARNTILVISSKICLVQLMRTSFLMILTESSFSWLFCCAVHH